MEDVDHLERMGGAIEEQDEVEADMIALCVRGCRLGIILGGLCARCDVNGKRRETARTYSAVPESDVRWNVLEEYRDLEMA